MSLSRDTFERELYTRMGRDYRLRWSDVNRSWCIEQQIGRAVWELPGAEQALTHPDTLIRARDGFTLVCEVQARPFVECEECHGLITVPSMTIGEAWCKACEKAGERPIKRVLGYIPLSEILLRRLDSTSPKRHGTWQREMDTRNRLLIESLDRDDDNEMDAVVGDYFNRFMNIPQVGFSGSITSK